VEGGLVNLRTGHQFSDPRVTDANPEIIRGKTRREDENCALLAYYAVSNGNPGNPSSRVKKSKNSSWTS
jgi:hypothetical protein